MWGLGSGECTPAWPGPGALGDRGVMAAGSLHRTAAALALPPPVAMAGKECVAIASDLRLGVQLQTMATDKKKLYRVHDQLFLGLSGLATDADTL